MPDQAAEVLRKLNHLIQHEQWIKTAKRPAMLQVPESLDVIVQLKEGVDIQHWMKKFDAYGIRLKKRVAPRQPYYVVTKDPARGSANDFLQYIRQDEDVVNAQWDRALQIRE
jgi:hypothetical protein